MPNQEAEERSCRDFEDLKTKICIYARDMKLQGVSVTFEKSRRSQKRKVPPDRTRLDYHEQGLEALRLATPHRGLRDYLGALL